MWQPVLEPSAWLRADAVFKSSSADEDDAEGGRWRKNSALPETWPMQVLGVTLLCRLTSFRHLGVFPEQLPHWQWMLDWLGRRGAKTPRVLNLFAYTGAASLIAAQRRGRSDARRCVQEGDRVGQAEPGGLQARRGRRPLDHRGCAQVRGARGPAWSSTYDFILVDPPKFGRGPEGEVWDVFAHLAPLLRDCAALLAPAVGAGAHHLRHPCLGPGDGRPGARMPGRTRRGASKAASLPSSSSPADACCRPPCSPAGRAMKPPPEPLRGTRAVTSLQNERVKFIRALEMRKTRRETGLFVAEGASVLVSARDAGWKPRMLVFLAGSAGSGVHRELLRWAEGAGAECLEVSEAVLGKLAAKENPQTMLGVFEQQWKEMPDPKSVPEGHGLAGAGGHSRSGQPRHHHPHGRRRRRQRHPAGRCLLRPLFARVGTGHDGLDLQRAAGARRGRAVPCLGARAGREMWSARTCRAARTSAPRPTGSLC